MAADLYDRTKVAGLMAIEKMKQLGGQLSDARARSLETSMGNLSTRLRAAENRLGEREMVLMNRGYAPSYETGGLHSRVANLSQQCDAAMASLAQWKAKTSNLERAVYESNERVRMLEQEVRNLYAEKELMKTMYAKAKKQLENRVSFS